MKLKIKKIVDTVLIPKYKSKQAAGFDLHALDTVTVYAGNRAKIRTGLAFEVPEGYELQIRPRSGLSAETFLRISNSPGTIDSDYRGEVYILIDNIAQNQAHSIVIKAGDRVAQAVLTKVEHAEFEESIVLSSTERGEDGIGSSGI